jgi:hypothetical protein
MSKGDYIDERSFSQRREEENAWIKSPSGSYVPTLILDR